VIRVVPDSNVILSGFTGEFVSTSTPGELIRRWQRGDFQLIVSHHILNEVNRAFTSSYYQDRFTLPRITGAMRLLRAEAELTPITVSVGGVASHPEDDLVLAAAVSAKVDYLFTGDATLKKLDRYQGVTIVTPREFLTRLEEKQTIEET